MKKIVLWFLSTLTVVVLMFGYRTSTQGALPTAAPQAVISGGSTGPSSTGSSSGVSGSSQGSSGRNGKGNSASNAVETVTGDVASTQWGPVQVRLTIRNGTITNVSIVQYPSGNPQDAQINGFALPQLIQETLNAQSARIDMVSGATVTSGGYLQSLQSALDRAGL